MKKISSVLLVVLIVLLTGTALADQPSSQLDERNVRFVERLFSKTYSIYDNLGREITAEFYDCTTAMYQNGEYNSIIEYLLQNVSYAEFVTKETSTSATRSVGRSSHDNVKVIRDFYKIVDDLNHGLVRQNVIYGTVVLSYVVNSNQGEIISVSNPNVTEADLQYWYGDGTPSVSVSNKSAAISPDKFSATFSFTVNGKIVIESATNPEVNGIAYRYEADFAFTEYVE